MAKRKTVGKKIILASQSKSHRPAPVWATYKKFQKRARLWRLNQHMRKHWRKKYIYYG